MTDHVELRHTYEQPPERVQEVLTDPEYLRAKLGEVGGSGAELVSLERDDDTGAVTVVQRQTIPSNALPTFAQGLVPGDVVIERTENWNGTIGGTLQAVVKGTPVRISGSMALTPRDGGATFTVRIETKVPIPLFGVAVEKLINENITKLMDREYEFTTGWLRDRGE